MVRRRNLALGAQRQQLFQMEQLQGIVNSEGISRRAGQGLEEHGIAAEDLGRRGAVKLGSLGEILDRQPGGHPQPLQLQWVCAEFTLLKIHIHALPTFFGSPQIRLSIPWFVTRNRPCCDHRPRKVLAGNSSHANKARPHAAISSTATQQRHN